MTGEVQGGLLSMRVIDLFLATERCKYVLSLWGTLVKASEHCLFSTSKGKNNLFS